jgi:hypothetical protein
MAYELITETMTLPSSPAKLYGENFDGQITLRAMTTAEERIRLSGQSFYKTMTKIVNECIVDNKKPDGSYKIDAAAFTDFDFFAVLVKLRILSYGTKYRTIATCRTCGRQFITTVDLSELTYNLVPEDFSEPYTIGPLPHSGDTLGCRFLRVKDKLDIEKEKQKILTRNPEFEGDPAYELEMERRIMEVNGSAMDVIAAKEYVRHMIGMDSQVYHDNIHMPYGLVRIGFVPCEGCGELSHWVLSPDSEFFRYVADSDKD